MGQVAPAGRNEPESKRLMQSGLVACRPLGVTVLGHTMAVVEEVAVVGLLGVLLFGAAVWVFARQE